MGKRRKKNNQAGVGSIFCIAAFLLIVISIQIARLYQKDQLYAAREAELNVLYEEETERESKLSDYEEYIDSQEYVEDTARSKLGLIYDDEIIFREK